MVFISCINYGRDILKATITYFFSIINYYYYNRCGDRYGQGYVLAGLLGGKIRTKMSSLRPTRRRTASVKENAIPTDILSNRETVSPSVTTNRKKKKQCSRQATRGLSQSCHQCRQSIHSSKGANEMKLGHQRIKCSQCTRYW